MRNSQQHRLYIIILGMILVIGVIIFRLVSYQVVDDGILAKIGHNIHYRSVVAQPDRGIIYDRNNAVLAGNGSDYQVGVSPSLITEVGEMATALAPILGQPRYDILTLLESNQPYVLLAGRVSPEVAEALRLLPFADDLQIDPLPRRIYPQEDMLCHVLGYTDFDGLGGAGIEGFYQRELAGEAASATINISPLTAQESVIAREGSDLVLTIDRTVQYAVETQLLKALQQYRAESGTIIVMDPRTGAILAMANYPCYEPYTFFEAEETVLLNPSSTQQYEPGSVMKLITMAAALDSGTVTPQTTYYDAGFIELGGLRLYNWDRSARGTVDMTGLLAHSLNVGAATIANWMGPDMYYSYMQRFGFGRPTGIDLMSEGAGQLPLPGGPDWTETNLGTNAFGQGLAVTPLQMISSVSALANDGYLMRPYLVQSIYNNDGQVFHHDPTVIGRPISKQAANQLVAMAVSAVAQEVPEAQVQGYTIAGKTGTAQIPVGGIYHPDDTIASFIGWLPADEPELIILVKLDRPQESPWGSKTAAPTFAALVEELVVLLDIPPDAVRFRQDVTALRGDQ